MRDRMRRLLACLCLAACCPCCFPCYICAIRSRKRRRQQEEYEAVMEHQRLGPRSPDQVHPLRRGRRRRISIPSVVRRMGEGEKGGVVETEDEELVDEKGDTMLGRTQQEDEKQAEKEDLAVYPSTTTEEHQKTFSQSQSLLFQKLPPELRSLIWRECVGSYNIYLGVVDGEKRVRHCKIFPNNGLMGLEADQEEQDKLMAQHHFISMLQSCRRIYTEAIPHAYSSNAFLLSTPRTLLSLSASTLTHRFNAITSLTIKYTPQLQHGLSFGLSAHDMTLWTRTSHLLSSMRRLRNLNLVFWDRSLYGAPGQWDNLEALLEMLKGVRQCKVFSVVLDQREEVEGLREKLGDDVPYELSFGHKDDGERLFWLI